MMAAILVPVGGIDRCAQRHLKLLGNRAEKRRKRCVFREMLIGYVAW